jgi:hypothetical protein
MKEEPSLRTRTIFTDCDHAISPEPLLAKIRQGATRRIASYWSFKEGASSGNSESGRDP